MILVSLILFFLMVVIFSELVVTYCSVSVMGSFALSLAAYIGLESCLLNLLSPFHAISGKTLLLTHIGIFPLWLIWKRVQGKGTLFSHWSKIFSCLKRLVNRKEFLLLSPLLVLLGLTAWIYPPNNYDSLTYHMARVAHWIQNGSIDYYPTIIDRQNQMGPGAEYLILFFQAINGTDELANSIQFFSYFFLFVSVGYIVRVLRVSKTLGPYVIILTVTAPIAVFQASSTKNDLVAALMTYSILAAALRFIVGHYEKAKTGDYVFLGISCASAFLVKPTSLLVAMPLVATGICYQFPRILKVINNKRQLITGCLIVVSVFFCIAGPDIYRKGTHHVTRHEVYPLFSEYTAERFWNPINVMAHNVPVSNEVKRFLWKSGVKGELRIRDVLNLHEDMVGNPFQVVFFLLLSFLTFFSGFCYFNKHLKILFLSLAPVGSWLLFGWIIKDQAWITRLEIPLFFILPFSFVFFSVILRRLRLVRGVLVSFTVVTSIASLGYALLTASNVPARQLSLSHFWGETPGRVAAYYNNAPLKESHDSFLGHLKSSQCQQIGLILGPDSVDYPLTWQIMQLGATVQHLWYQEHSEGKSSFVKLEDRFKDVCMIYVASGSIEHVPSKGEQWLSAGDYHTFFRNVEWDFINSGKTCLNIEQKDISKQLILQADLEVVQNSPESRLLATGGDPQLTLPALQECSRAWMIMKVEMNSSVDTTAQVFYQTNSIPYYTEPQSVKQPIHVGENTIYFRLPNKEMTGNLRFDPAKKEGLYHIESIEIRAVE